MSEESEVENRNVEASNFLVRKDKASALKKCLENPPVNAKNEELKDKNMATVEMVLTAISDSEFPSLLAGLDLEQSDILMKYVYKLMGKSSNCASMLKLHAQLVEKAGHGSIVRVMTDRKQV